jgi:hypothetical protein
LSKNGEVLPDKKTLVPIMFFGSCSVVPLFRPAAQELVKTTGLPVIDLLAKALAKISGQTEIKRRSLLSSHDDATTLILKSGTSMYSPGYVHNGSFYAKSIFIHPPMHCFSHYLFFL